MKEDNSLGSRTPPRTEKRLILIVEDDPDIAHVLMLILADEGYVVACAAGGTAALKLLETHAPACILLDTKMDSHPDGILDGHWFLQQLKQRGRWYPIIAMAATPSFLDESVRQGCAAVLVKPFEMDELLETIKQVVQ
jgi:two-component system, NtrC family, response regulator AtoC